MKQQKRSYKFTENCSMLIGTIVVLCSIVIIWGITTKWKFISKSNKSSPTPRESYTIAPAALYEEGIANIKPAGCFTAADTGPPWNDDPNGSCQKDTTGDYGTSFGYNIYQNTTTYDPNSNLNYGYIVSSV